MQFISMRGAFVAGLVAGLPLAGASPARAEEPYQVQWTRQLGTSAGDWANGIATDSAGNLFITGYTEGSLGGPHAGGTLDAFVAKYDTTGTLAWTRQLGTNDWDDAIGIATDSAGNLFITGTILGSLGGPNAGSWDAFVAKYDATGTLAWTRQLGTNDWDDAIGIATDSAGNLFITGRTTGSLGGPNAGIWDAYVAKYDTTGALAWTRQLGTGTYDDASGIATDSAGNVFITGQTTGSLGGPNAGSYDAFVAKYDATGTLAWTRQLGTSTEDLARGIATDSAGNLFITGWTLGSLGGPNAGIWDAYVAKYDTTGALAWTRQLGTSGDDEARGIATDSAGNLFITGYTEGPLGGPNAGGWDAFVAKYDTTGALAWTRQLGTSMLDVAYGIATDSAGNLFIAGETTGSLGGPNAGGFDAFVAKLAVPEPATLGVLALGGLSLCRRRADEA